jgi:hypothetical protein
MNEWMTKLSSVFWDSFVCTCGKCVHHVSSLTQIFVQVHLLAALAFSLSLSPYIYIYTLLQSLCSMFCREQDKKNNLNLYLCLFEINLKFTSFCITSTSWEKNKPPSGNKTKKTTSIFIYVSLKLISSSLHFHHLHFLRKK